jgi:hypothetical protein
VRPCRLAPIDGDLVDKALPRDGAVNAGWGQRAGWFDSVRAHHKSGSDGHIFHLQSPVGREWAAAAAELHGKLRSIAVNSGSCRPTADYGPELAARQPAPT